jgi:hypothetical protein
VSRRPLTGTGVAVFAVLVIACGGGPPSGNRPAPSDRQTPATADQPEPPPVEPLARPRPQSIRERFDALVKAAREKRRPDLEAEVATLKADLAKAEADYKRMRNTATLKSKLEKGKAEVERLKTAHAERAAELAALGTWAPGCPPDEFREGELARLGANGKGVSIEVLQVVDEANVLVRYRRDEIVWLEMPTRGLVDGRSYLLAGVGEGRGTRRYTTPIGTTRTVPCVRVDID